MAWLHWSPVVFGDLIGRRELNRCLAGVKSSQFIPDPTSAPVLVQMPAFDQYPEMLLERIAAHPGQFDGLRLAAKSLLHRLKAGHPKVLVQDWYKDTQTKKMVRSAVEKVLDSNLPESYDRVLFREKCDNVFYLMLDYASHGRKWAA